MDGLKERFSQARSKRGYTQKSLADAIGVTRGVISNIEYGKTDPPQIVINAVCQVLSINEEWLRHGTGPMEPEVRISPATEEIIKILERLPEPLRLVLLDTANSLERNLMTEKRD